MMKQYLFAALASIALCTSAYARDQVRVVGSSTVFPFTTAVAETFGRSSNFRTPIVESTGTGGGFQLFCSGIGVNTPDVANASRPILASEWHQCKANGVDDLIEIKIGFDGIVIANIADGFQYDLTIAQVFLALAKSVPQDGKLVPNPYRTWHDIDESLPKHAIRVYGPPPTSGTRDAFVELTLDVGCLTFEEIRALPDAERKAVCGTIREDGAFIEAGENDNLIIQRLQANPTTLGIFGFSFLDQNYDVVQGALINGVAPEFENIASGDYPVARSMYIYAKKAHIPLVASLHGFLKEYVKEGTFGREGYLVDKGLIPLPTVLREHQRAVVDNLIPMSDARFTGNHHLAPAQ